MNQAKTFFFMAVLTILFVFLGNLLGGRQGAIIALVIAAGMNFFSYWYSDKLVLSMYKAKPVTEAEAPELYNLVRELSQRAGLPMPKVYIIPNDSPNAFATGRSPSHAAVAVTTGALNLLSFEELAGVLGHELTHVKNRDILIGTIAATFAGAISFLATMARFGAIFGGVDDDEGGGNIFVVLIVSIFASLAAMLIQMAISRSREYLADEGGARISGNPRYLANALRKLDAYAKRIPFQSVNPSTSHMFIVNPLKGGGLASLFQTHPPIEERIERLERMAV
ncbi:MAG: zinc metalloprotease HtpX [Deltaproteobacteria bacterium]|nr:MAG: zinc metalloprotease HtpX [Deltaproteobacteria bacterium]